MKCRIFLWGMPGSGKTTLGKKLAAKMQVPFFDLDACIEKQEGASVKHIFEEKGESYFRELEKKVLLSLLQQPKFVLACGGGTPLFFSQDELMLQNGTVVYLQAPAGMLYRRVEKEISVRPLLHSALENGEGAKALEQMLEKRSSIYEKAHITFAVKEHKNRISDLLQILQTSHV